MGKYGYQADLSAGQQRRKTVADAGRDGGAGVGGGAAVLGRALRLDGDGDALDREGRRHRGGAHTAVVGLVVLLDGRLRGMSVRISGAAVVAVRMVAGLLADADRDGTGVAAGRGRRSDMASGSALRVAG